MAVKSIAIIGASGRMGSAIARSLSKGNYRLLLISSQSEKVKKLQNDIQSMKRVDVEIIDCTVNACWEADIIILAVPFSAEREVAERIRAVATGKVVISMSNPIMEKGLVTMEASSAAEELQNLLPYSKVIKAFNGTLIGDFEQQEISGESIDGFIAGNDDEALETVSELVRTAGFHPVEAGKLFMSRTLESMQALLIQLSTRYHYHGIAGWKIIHH